MSTHLLIVFLLMVTGPAYAQRDARIYDEDVTVVSFEDLEYPRLPRQARVQGAVVVEVSMDEGGAVNAAAALSGHKLLIPASVANARTWTFTPNAKKRAVIVYDFRVDMSVSCKYDHDIFQKRHVTYATVTACTMGVR